MEPQYNFRQHGCVALSHVRRLSVVRCWLAGRCRSRAATFAQIDPRTALLEKAAGTRSTAGRRAARPGSFRDALAADPRNARLHLGAGLAAYLERRDADARAPARARAGARSGAHRGARAARQVQHRLGDVPPRSRRSRLVVARRARRPRMPARRSNGGGASSSCTIACSRRSARTSPSRSKDRPRKRWRRRRSPRSIARTGASARSWAPFRTTPVPVVLYTDRAVPRHHAVAVVGGGAFDGTIRVPMRGRAREAAASSIACSRTNSRTRSSAALAPRGVPTWLNEGLASALEDRRPGRGPSSARARRAGAGAAAGAAVGVRPARRRTGAARVRHQRARRRAGCSTRPAARRSSNLLRDLGEGVDFEAAFLHRMQRPFAELGNRVIGSST